MRFLIAGVLGLLAAGVVWAWHGRLSDQDRIAALEQDLSRIIQENRLRRPGEPPRRTQPQDLETWAAEIDKLVQESYGQLLRLSLSEAQIRGIVKSLEERVASPVQPDLASPTVREKLREVVDGLVSEHLYERGFILKRKTPSTAEVAEKVGLENDQRDSFERIFSDTRVAVVDLARTKLPDGVDILADLYRLENVPWASNERGLLEWQLLSTEVQPDRTFHAWLTEQERVVTARLAGILTADQMARFQFLKLVPWDLVGMAMQSPSAK